MWDYTPGSSHIPILLAIKRGLGMRLPRMKVYYCTARNFWGRKLSQILRFCGYSQKFSLRNYLGCGILRWHNWQHQQAIHEKFSPQKILFSTNLRKFSPRKSFPLTNWKTFGNKNPPAPKQSPACTCFECLDGNKCRFIPHSRPDLAKVALTQLLLELECGPLNLPLISGRKNMWCHYDIIVILFVVWLI